jgi:phosphate transport system protein
MNVHLHREVEKLKKKILSYSGDVESSLKQAIKALKERDLDLADKVYTTDEILDQIEVEIEEDCLKILALHTPVANDLRFIVAVLKINNDLERIADNAVNIAKRVKSLSVMKTRQFPHELNIMADRAQFMLKKSIEALIDLDVDKAWKVIDKDNEVDDLNRQMFIIIQKEMCENPEDISHFLSLLTISKNLERVADQVTNIAEDVIYMVEGEIVRHQ